MYIYDNIIIKGWIGGECMPLKIIRNDITKMGTDAIVNPTNRYLDGSGGTDKAIHIAAGRGLQRECRTIGELKVGEAKVTKGYDLPSKYIIHTRGPIWKDGKSGEDELLSNCYRNALALARELNLNSIAFPLIASGTFGYPKDRALGTAISTIGEFLLEDDMMVYLVVYDKQAFKLSEKLFSSIKEYIDDRYIEECLPWKAGRREAYRLEEGYFVGEISYYNEAVSPREHKRDLKDVVNDVDEGFSEMLLRLIDERGRNDSEVYKSANIDRRLFSKIRNDVDYKPSKPTAIAFAIALELSLDETKDLLLRAGYALSPSNKFDLIIEYFIKNRIYNIFEVNEALFAFDQKLLGV